MSVTKRIASARLLARYDAPFLRNIAMCLDERLWRDKLTTPVFSQSV